MQDQLFQLKGISIVKNRTDEYKLLLSIIFLLSPRKLGSIMKKISFLLCILILIKVTTVHAQNYLLGTASTGGTYHPVGTAISTLSKVKLLPNDNFSLTAVTSSGSGANVQALGAGTADFAILQGLYGYYAASGSGPITSPQEHIRSISMLWLNVEQFVIPTTQVKTGTVQDLIDLKGSIAGMGKQSSGTFDSNKVLLAGLGIDIKKDFKLI